MQSHATPSAKLTFVATMLIFGTIGIFVRWIPLSSGVIALTRGIIGMLFLLAMTALRRQGLSRSAIRENALALCLSGACIGANWILLFEAYRYTTVATATLCYYMAPIFVTLLSPLLLRERLTARKGLCVLAALVGMVFVSGVPASGLPSLSEGRGILLGLGAAVFYTCVILLNKRLHDIGAYDKTIVQLGAASIVLLPYLLLTEDFSALTLTVPAAALLLVVGIFHTGVAYAMYFGSMSRLGAQTIALFSYIDPIVAIVLSALLLHEPMGGYEIFGAVLVLGSTLVSELPQRRES